MSETENYSIPLYDPTAAPNLRNEGPYGVAMCIIDEALNNHDHSIAALKQDVTDLETKGVLVKLEEFFFYDRETVIQTEPGSMASQTVEVNVTIPRDLNFTGAAIFMITINENDYFLPMTIFKVAEEPVGGIYNAYGHEILLTPGLYGQTNPIFVDLIFNWVGDNLTIKVKIYNASNTRVTTSLSPVRIEANYFVGNKPQPLPLPNLPNIGI